MTEKPQKRTRPREKICLDQDVGGAAAAELSVDVPRLAGIAIFCVVEECVFGPRGGTPIVGVEAALWGHYPSLLETYDAVRHVLHRHGGKL
jgi:hypothetical protein